MQKAKHIWSNAILDLPMCTICNKNAPVNITDAMGVIATPHNLDPLPAELKDPAVVDMYTLCLRDLRVAYSNKVFCKCSKTDVFPIEVDPKSLH